MKTTGLLEASKNGNIPIGDRINTLQEGAIIRFENESYESFHQLCNRIKTLLLQGDHWKLPAQWSVYLYYRGKYYFHYKQYDVAQTRFEEAIKFATIAGREDIERRARTWLQAIPKE
jgi:hypothetical protein